VAKGDPDDTNKTLTDAVYRHAFEDEPQRAEVRKYMIEERLGLISKGTPKRLAEARQALRPLGFDRSMIDTVRDKSLGGLLLLLHHSGEILCDDVSRGNIFTPVIQPKPSSITHRGVRHDGGSSKPSFGVSFNRALAQTDEDIAAIDAAILAVTGKEPPGGPYR
jgi:hypothetical protein